MGIQRVEVGEYGVVAVKNIRQGVFALGLGTSFGHELRACLRCRLVKTYAQMDAMRDVSATEAAIVYGLEPVWGAAFAWFLLGERWDTTEWLGAALVLCGSLIV